jgi:hypothetical protein
LNKPKVTIDIAPLLDDHWTGIPVFTRRLVQAFLQNSGLDLDFPVNGNRIPTNSVLDAIKSGSGICLRDECGQGLPARKKSGEGSGRFWCPTVKKVQASRSMKPAPSTI